MNKNRIIITTLIMIMIMISATNTNAKKLYWSELKVYAYHCLGMSYSEFKQNRIKMNDVFTSVSGPSCDENGEPDKQYCLLITSEQSCFHNLDTPALNEDEMGLAGQEYLEDEEFNNIPYGGHGAAAIHALHRLGEEGQGPGESNKDMIIVNSIREDYGLYDPGFDNSIVSKNPTQAVHWYENGGGDHIDLHENMAHEWGHHFHVGHNYTCKKNFIYRNGYPGQTNNLCYQWDRMLKNGMDRILETNMECNYENACEEARHELIAPTWKTILFSGKTNEIIWEGFDPDQYEVSMSLSYDDGSGFEEVSNYVGLPSAAVTDNGSYSWRIPSGIKKCSGGQSGDDDDDDDDDDSPLQYCYDLKVTFTPIGKDGDIEYESSGPFSIVRAPEGDDDDITDDDDDNDDNDDETEPGEEGGDPDENYNLGGYLLPNTFENAPVTKVKVFKEGFHWDNLVANLGVNRKIVRFDLTEIGEISAENPPVVILPTNSLASVANSSIFRLWLEEYVSAGGTLLVFTQSWGELFDALPRGDEMEVYGYVEDRHCEYGSVYAREEHFLIASQSRGLASVNIDGFFNLIQNDAEEILTRQKNGLPALIEYPVGAGRVIATNMYSDWAFTHFQSYSDERRMFGDLVSYAQEPESAWEEPGRVVSPGDTAEIDSFTVENLSGQTSAQIVICDVKSNGDEVSCSTAEPFALQAGSSTTYYHSVYNASNRGIHRLVYHLQDSDGNPIQNPMEPPDGHFIVWDPPSEIVNPEENFAMWVTSSGESYPAGKSVPFTIGIRNSTGETEYGVLLDVVANHELITENLLIGDLESNPSPADPYTIPYENEDEILYYDTRYDFTLKAADGTTLASATRSIWVENQPFAGILSIEGNKTNYLIGDSVSASIWLAKDCVEDETFTWEFEFVKNGYSEPYCDDQCFQSGSFVQGPGQETFTENFTDFYTFVDDDPYGGYTITFKVWDSDDNLVLQNTRRISLAATISATLEAALSDTLGSYGETTQDATITVENDGDTIYDALVKAYVDGLEVGSMTIETIAPGTTQEPMDLEIPFTTLIDDFTIDFQLTSSTPAVDLTTTKHVLSGDSILKYNIEQYLFISFNSTT